MGNSARAGNTAVWQPLMSWKDAAGAAVPRRRTVAGYHHLPSTTSNTTGDLLGGQARAGI